MKRLAVLLVALLALLNVRGDSKLPGTFTARSRSGQFVVYGAPQSSFVSPNIATNTSLVQLDPVLLAVSCERIKQALLSQLMAADNWRGKIFLVLHRAENADEAVVITSEKFSDRWDYRVDLPDAMTPPRLVCALTQVLLLEMANRNAGERSAELPAWLNEGMPELLLAASDVEFVIQSPRLAVNNLKLNNSLRDVHRKNSLARAREILASHAPLSFQELSWPKPEQLNGDVAEVYRSSAQLFISELSRLKNGRVALRNFIFSLSRDLNWQLTFLRAFHSEFTHLLDLEKWWALVSVHFVGHDPTQSWTMEESWKKLTGILHPDVQVRLGANNFPMRAEVSLQSIIREWDFIRQTQMLREKIRQLRDAQLRVAPPLINLGSQYRQQLENYLQQMEKAGPMRPVAKKIIEETLKQLDALDAKAEALRTMPIAVPSESVSIP